MNERLNFALKKSKAVFIIILILWIVFSIVLIAPVSISWVDAVIKHEGSFLDKMFETNFGDVFKNLGKAFSSDYIKIFLKNEMWMTIALIGFAIVVIVKSIPKHDYAGGESGSSDLATGEQYSVLSKHKGILLAEKHYLPVDKRGNTNVLVVGRFWFW